MIPAIGRFLAVALLLAAATAVIHLEVRWLLGHVGEDSLVEYMQELILAVTVAMFLLLVAKRPAQRGAAVLVGGFFAVLLIREMDSVFDQIVHGFWKYPAVLLAATAIGYAYRHPQTTGMPLVAYSRHSSFGLMIAGMAILMVFSRLFGMGILWNTLMGEQYVRGVKNLAEEGTELLAYCLIFCSSAWYTLSQLADKRSKQPS
ncbi:hypothetical protein [Ferrimonas pelagia]